MGRMVYGGALLALFFLILAGVAAAQRGATIFAPANGATVSGQIAIATESSKLSWINLDTDGVRFASNSPPVVRRYPVSWNSTKATTGGHATSVKRLGSANQLLGANSIKVRVYNAAAAPTPTGTPRTVRPVATSTSLTYYVSLRGNDNLAGTAAAPWRTVQHAVSRLLPGQSAVILAGTYLERVSITSSGTAVAPITIRAAGGAVVKLRGFNISGSYWVISGFDISNQSNKTDGYGIYVFRAAAHDTISNNYIHELCHEGIYMEPTVSYISVISNWIWRAEMAGAQIDGIHELITKNIVWGTQQRPAMLGGIYGGCATPNDADADGFRFFGQHHDIAHNYIHDIAYGTRENPNPHIDCLQTWGSGAMKVDDVTFERNYCRWSSASARNHAAVLEGTSGPVGTLVLKNNIFANMEDGLIIGEGQPSGVAVVKIWNNTFDHIRREAVQFNDRRTGADEVSNNIFFDVGGDGDSYMCITGGSPAIRGNDFYMRGGVKPGTYCSSAPYISVNPMFVSAGDSTGAGADYHLQAASPVKDNGVRLPQVTNDLDARPRPVGAGYSIGAYER